MLLFIQRYGNPRYSAPEHKAFSTYFRSNTALSFLNSSMQMLLLKANGRYISPEVTRMCLGYLSASVELSPTFKVIKQHLDVVLFQVMFPALCVSDEELMLYDDDPTEYIKSVLEPAEDWLDPRMAAITLLINLAKYRQKDLFPKFLPFVQQALAEYQTASSESTRNYKMKDGILLAVASVADIFRSNKAYATILPSFISIHVLPEFVNPVSFVRARAVWSIQKFTETDYGKDQTLLQNTMLGLLQSLKDVTSPVQTAAANAIGVLVEAKSTAAVVEPLIPQLICEYLRIVQETENMDVLVTLQTIVGRFGDIVKPMALEMVSHLQAVFQEFAKDDDDETGSVFSASQCLETIVSLIDICQEDSILLSQLEVTLTPLMFHLLRDGQHSFEYLTTCLDMLGYFTYFSTGTYSEGLWRLCGAMLDAMNDWAFDFMNEMLSPLLTFLTRGASIFLQSVHNGIPYVTLYLSSIQKGFESTVSEIEHDARVAATMLSCLLVSVGSAAPRALDSILPAIITIYLTRLQISKRKVLRLQLLEVGLASLFYNPALTFQIMDSQGTIVIQSFFSELLSQLKHLTNDMSRRLLLYAFTRILLTPTEQLPSLISANLIPIHREVIKAAFWLEEEFNKEENDDDDVFQDADEYYNGGDDDDDDDGNGFDEDVDAAGLKAVRRAMRHAGVVVPDGGFDEDEDCLNDEQEAFELAMEQFDREEKRKKKQKQAKHASKRDATASSAASSADDVAFGGGDEDVDVDSSNANDDDDDDDAEDFAFTMPEPLLDCSAFLLSQYQILKQINPTLEAALLGSLTTEEMNQLDAWRRAVIARADTDADGDVSSRAV